MVDMLSIVGQAVAGDVSSPPPDAEAVFAVAWAGESRVIEPILAARSVMV